ncbi:amino acid kinase [Candidatus Thorarchaeota archaeon]|nr:MAG: amino acid kinase [Candidatus Thorarchaeota archaeon]
MSNDLTVLKLGGSLLTDKSKPYTPRMAVMKSVCEEIRQCINDELLGSLILIQGVGSFGHPPVLEHHLHMGFKGPKQLLPLSDTQSTVGKFRAMLVEQLQQADIPVCLMYPSSMVVAERMKMTRYFFEPLRGFLSIGMVPLLGGDILIDSVMGFTVGSGDQLAVLIAKELKAKKIIFASDVAGIFDSDPKTNPDAELYSEIDIGEVERTVEEMGKSTVIDASGAMKGKLKSLIPARPLLEAGLEVSILSMMESGNLADYLKGNTSTSTQIVSR